MVRIRCPAALLALVATAFACDPARVRGPDAGLVIEHPFPTQERLDEIAQSPPPSAVKLPAIRAVERWSMREPVATHAATTTATDEDSQALQQLLGARSQQRVTTQMNCFAREMTVFTIEQGAQPAEDLRAAIAGRCGVGLGRPAIAMHRTGSANAVAIDVSRDRAEIQRLLAPVPASADLGIGIARSGDRTLMMIAAAKRSASFEAVAIRPGSDRVIVRGESVAPLGWITGRVTRGEYEVLSCEAIASGKRNRRAFALSCPIDLDDPEATIEVTLAEPERLLGEVALSFWLAPTGVVPQEWVARSIPVPVSADDSSALAWLTGINTLRDRAKLGRWTHAQEQSTLISGLLPHLVAADDHKLRDDIALGMLAGWKVEGTIGGASIAVASVPLGLPLERTLGAAMSSPNFRAVALDHGSDSAAIASWDVGAAKASSVAIVNYSLFTAREYHAEEQIFMDQLDADRAARGLPPIRRITDAKDLAVLDAAAARVRAGESAPMEELKGILEHFTAKTQHGFGGNVFTTLQLDGWRPTFSGPIAEAQKVIVITRIGDWRPPGSAWGQHVVYVVYAVVDSK